MNSSLSAKRPATVRALIVLLAVQAVGAIGGGIGLVQDPIDNIGMPLDILEGSPFTDYFYPGLILLVVVGVFPLLVLPGIVMRKRWAWWLAVAAGAGLIVWIVTEVVLLGYLAGMGITLQIVMGLIGVAVVLLCFAGSTRRYFGIGR
jgi:hypothetical protein